MTESSTRSTTPAATAVPTTAPGWDRRLQQAVIIIARLGLAYIFFSGFLWKMPPRFGCANNFAFPVANAEGRPDPNGSTGLCYWMGLETVYASQERKVLVADLQYIGGQQFGVNISPIAQLNAAFLDGIVKPNIAVFGYLIWGAEVLIFLTMFLGLFTRLGGLLAIGIASQLYIGLANIPSPYEWEWAYGQMVLLAILMFGLAPGRILGLDALLRPRLMPAAARGNRLAQLVLLLT
ncbi:MAG TPA: TQO small subunit DoxD [Roseiflexaceae bacterium]|nr:TQO small subunit DoxD [Roseiflexaceae bacterium]HMP41689.1 TQO small subunit DoxD [Roseiflexaceae bacterium]